MTTFAENIVRLRELQHFNHSDVELHGGPSVRRQGFIEKGSDPTYKELWAYCEALGRQLWELLAGVDEHKEVRNGKEKQRS